MSTNHEWAVGRTGFSQSFCEANASFNKHDSEVQSQNVVFRSKKRSGNLLDEHALQKSEENIR